MQSSKCSNSHNWHLLSSNPFIRKLMKKILGTLLILTNIVIFSGCTFINEEEKFNPVALKIESTDLAQTTRDEYTIPAGGGQLTVYSAEEKNPFCLVNWFEVNGVECYLNGVENDLYNDRADYSYDWGEIIISSATLPVKNNITIRPNLSGKERKIRIGLNCFKYDYRILDIIQRSNESKP